MSKIVIVTCAFLLGIACIVADMTNRRLKLAEADIKQLGDGPRLEVAFQVDEERAGRHADRDNFQRQLDATNIRLLDLTGEVRTVEANKCSCPSPMPCTCSAPSPCKCKKDACCAPKQVETKPPPVSKFCRFTMIQIDGVAKTAWFKWLDVDGVEHETRMSLPEFEAWGEK